MNLHRKSTPQQTTTHQTTAHQNASQQTNTHQASSNQTASHRADSHSKVQALRPAGERIRIVLNILIVIALLGIGAALAGFRHIRSERVRLMRQAGAADLMASDTIVKDVLSRYRLPEELEVIGVLNDTLMRTGLSEAIMDITPGAVTDKDGVLGYPVRLRLAPVPGNRIADLLNAIEYQEPRLMIVALQMTRIRSGDDAVDVTLDLMGFR